MLSELSYFLFLFDVQLDVELHLLQSSSARNQEPSSRGGLNKGLTRLTQGLHLDLEIALGRCRNETLAHMTSSVRTKTIATSPNVICRSFNRSDENSSSLFLGSW